MILAELLAAVLADPDADEPRLLAADWLEDNGEPERAEFIRVQIELAKPVVVLKDDLLSEVFPGQARNTALAREKPRLDALRRRERELVSPVGKSITLGWVPDAVLAVGKGTTFHWAFRRGFIETIQCSWADWLSHHQSVRAATPLRKCRLTTMPARDWLEFACRYYGVAYGENVRGEPCWRTKALAAEWPGIDFELPPTRDHVLGVADADADSASEYVNVRIGGAAR